VQNAHDSAAPAPSLREIPGHPWTGFFWVRKKLGHWQLRRE